MSISPQGLTDLFESHLEADISGTLWQGPMYKPMAYILRLGGKRIRPTLLLAAYEAMSGRPAQEALNAALAVEFFHNFSLLHDDIMDNAPVRRGQPTVHEAWDSNTAILAGDAMFALCFELLIRDFPQHAAPLVREFTKISVGVCEGQMEDMEMAGQWDATIPQYIEMIRKKTAMLIGGTMSLAAIAAGCDADTVRLAYAYGEATGIGFQLQDDLLDVYAEQAKFGKQVAGDILEAKMTFLLIRALEKADAAQTAELRRLLALEGQPEVRIAGVKAIYAELDIPGETRNEMRTYFDQARQLGQELGQRFDMAVMEAWLGKLMAREH